MTCWWSTCSPAAWKPAAISQRRGHVGVSRDILARAFFTPCLRRVRWCFVPTFTQLSVDFSTGKTWRARHVSIIRVWLDVGMLAYDNQAISHRNVPSSPSLARRPVLVGWFGAKTTTTTDRPSAIRFHHQVISPFYVAQLFSPHVRSRCLRIPITSRGRDFLLHQKKGEGNRGAWFFQLASLADRGKHQGNCSRSRSKLHFTRAQAASSRPRCVEAPKRLRSSSSSLSLRFRYRTC